MLTKNDIWAIWATSFGDLHPFAWFNVWQRWKKAQGFSLRDDALENAEEYAKDKDFVKLLDHPIALQSRQFRSLFFPIESWFIMISQPFRMWRLRRLNNTRLARLRDGWED